MYTFAPIPTVPVDHAGFVLVTVPAALMWLVALYHAKEEGFSVFRITTILTAFVGFAYCVSFVWTEQQPTVYANIQVNGTLVGFVAEGYNEARHSGKTTTHVDVHNAYVEYDVSGQHVLLQARVGQTYPQQAILYKN